MRPSQLFKSQFTVEKLESIYRERIAHSATIGKDGIHPSTFGESLAVELPRVVLRVHQGGYRFTPYKQKLLTKGAGKPPREISIASVRDRVVLRALTHVLFEVFNDSKLVAPHYIISEIREVIRSLNEDLVFIQIDVKDFYPSLDHEHLMKRLRSRARFTPLLDLVSKAIKTPSGDASRSCVVGVPQGLSISNILSSIYMQDFDRRAKERCTYFRYVDDILVICSTKRQRAMYNWLTRQLGKIGLQSHPLELGSKTKIVPVSDGVEYLGYRLTPKQISVRKSSVKKIMDNTLGVITTAKSSANHAKILTRLNLKITGCIFDGKRMGWMFFFSMTEDIRQLQRLDNFVAKLWARAGMTQYGTPKRFVKAYHEIRFNADRTKYIPRFDEYTLEKKIELISVMRFKTIEEIQGWPLERINREFFRIVKKEISELEKDVTPTS